MDEVFLTISPIKALILTYSYHPILKIAVLTNPIDHMSSDAPQYDFKCGVYTDFRTYFKNYK